MSACPHCGKDHPGHQILVVGQFEAKYGVRAPGVPSPHSQTTPGQMTFTTLTTIKGN